MATRHFRVNLANVANIPPVLMLHLFYMEVPGRDGSRWNYKGLDVQHGEAPEMAANPD